MKYENDKITEGCVFDEINNIYVKIDPSLSFNESVIDVLVHNSIDYLFPAGATVNNTYLIFSGSNRHGTAIYYVTDKGDFVYYSFYNGVNYFVPAEKFFEAIRYAVSYIASMPPLPHGELLDIPHLRKFIGICDKLQKFIRYFCRDFRGFKRKHRFKYFRR